MVQAHFRKVAADNKSSVRDGCCPLINVIGSQGRQLICATSIYNKTTQNSPKPSGSVISFVRPMSSGMVFI